MPGRHYALVASLTGNHLRKNEFGKQQSSMNKAEVKRLECNINNVLICIQGNTSVSQDFTL